MDGLDIIAQFFPLLIAVGCAACMAYVMKSVVEIILTITKGE